MAFDLLPRLTGSASPLALRNTVFDWAVHDVGNLSSSEVGALSAEISLEGAILVVHPNEARAGVAVEKFEGFEAFLAAPGRRVSHFALAGAGASDLGAASLARTLANHLGETVGAIVAGYGAAELVEEAMGGRVFFGGSNRLLAPAEPPTPQEAEAALRFACRAQTHQPGWDEAMLIRLLTESGRRIDTLLGHSRGALSISFALQALAMAAPEAFARQVDARVITAGAARPMPTAMRDVTQFLGALDWLGELNSDPTVPRILAPRAWHHLNTQAPAHLDLAVALDGALG
ncbi:MAG: hypothetical protein AAF676_06340 [Pseudomonadota bacterium]